MWVIEPVMGGDTAVRVQHAVNVAAVLYGAAGAVDPRDVLIGDHAGVPPGDAPAADDAHVDRVHEST